MWLSIGLNGLAQSLLKSGSNAVYHYVEATQTPAPMIASSIYRILKMGGPDVLSDMTNCKSRGQPVLNVADFDTSSDLLEVLETRKRTNRGLLYLFIDRTDMTWDSGRGEGTETRKTLQEAFAFDAGKLHCQGLHSSTTDFLAHWLGHDLVGNGQCSSSPAAQAGLAPG